MRSTGVAQILALGTLTLLLQMLVSGEACSQSADEGQPNIGNSSEKIAGAGENKRVPPSRSLLRFCLLELEAASERLNTLDPDRWRTVPNHVFHCHMMIEAEFMLYRYRDVLGKYGGPSSANRHERPTPDAIAGARLTAEHR